MSIEYIKHSVAGVGESYYEWKHPTGVTVYVYPRPESDGVYAMFGAKCGSVDDNFVPYGEEEAVTVPAGIAHFLEHKLFESEELGAFERYAKTGAEANAFTSFDSTCYVFSCVENFEQSFEILLDFVQSPYFTEQTVAKEQGIIGQEIQMYDDDPDWQVFFTMLANMYINDHIRLDIAGTVESISHITADMLYKCYHAFYHPENMAICVAGRITPEEVAAVADRMLKPSEQRSPRRLVPDEPEQVGSADAEKRMDVAAPLFALGFKDKIADTDAVENQLLADVALRAVFGKYTALYERLLGEQLVNSEFSCEYMRVRGAGVSVVSGESAAPEKAREIIFAELEKIARDGVDEIQFECAKHDVYGETISELSHNSAICRALMNSYLYESRIDGRSEYVASITREQVSEFIVKHVRADRSVLSVVRPVSE